MTRKTAERVVVDQKALSVVSSDEFGGRWLKSAYYVDIWRAKHKGYVSPALLRYLADEGYLDKSEVAAVLTVEVPPCVECGEVHLKNGCPYNRKSNGQRKRRTRLAADVTPAQRDTLHALAAQAGMTWTEYCRSLADATTGGNDAEHK
jgi:hypothetical protein